MWAKSNVPAGIVFLVLGVVSLLVLIPYGIDNPPSVQFQSLSPSYWPTIVSLVVSTIGVVLLATGLLKRNRVSEAEAAQPDSSTWTSARPFLVFGICIAMYFALEKFGFVLTTSIGMLLLMLVGGERRIYLSLPICILIPLGLYAFFIKATGVAIPAGILEPWLLWI